MFKTILPIRAILFGALALLAIPACGGSSGGGSNSGSSGGTANPFALTDLAGDWTGHLTPRENSGLPWSNGDTRILSRNFYVRADGEGKFYYCEPGTEETYDGRTGEVIIRQTEISRKGAFTLTFKEQSGNREELILVGRINEARNIIEGDYELRSRTANTTGNEVEAVDAGKFTLILSNGPGTFTSNMLEGTFRGRNYHYAPRYTNLELTIDANGSLTGGFVDDGQKLRKFDLTGVNDLKFAFFDDTSVGQIDEIQLSLESGAVLTFQAILLSEDQVYLTGPVFDPSGRVTYMRLIRQ